MPVNNVEPIKFNKKRLAAIGGAAALMVAFVAYLAWSGPAVDEEMPPRLVSNEGGLQGFIKTDSGFAKITQAEEDAGEDLAWPDSKLAVGEGFYYATTDVKVGDLLKEYIEPKVNNQVLIVTYGMKGDKYEGFASYPLNTQLGEDTNSDGVADKFMYEMNADDVIPKYRGFIVVSRYEVRTKLKNSEDAPSNFRMPLNELEGWAIVPVDKCENIEDYEDRVDAMWSIREYDEDPEKVSSSDYLDDCLVSDFHMTWMKLDSVDGGYNVVITDVPSASSDDYDDLVDLLKDETDLSETEITALLEQVRAGKPMTVAVDLDRDEAEALLDDIEALDADSDIEIFTDGDEEGTLAAGNIVEDQYNVRITEIPDEDSDEYDDLVDAIVDATDMTEAEVRAILEDARDADEPANVAVNLEEDDAQDLLETLEEIDDVEVELADYVRGEEPGVIEEGEVGGNVTETSSLTEALIDKMSFTQGTSNPFEAKVSADKLPTTGNATIMIFSEKNLISLLKASSNAVLKDDRAVTASFKALEAAKNASAKTTGAISVLPFMWDGKILDKLAATDTYCAVLRVEAEGKYDVDLVCTKLTILASTSTAFEINSLTVSEPTSTSLKFSTTFNKNVQSYELRVFTKSDYEGTVINRNLVNAFSSNLSKESLVITGLNNINSINQVSFPLAPALAAGEYYLAMKAVSGTEVSYKSSAFNVQSGATPPPDEGQSSLYPIENVVAENYTVGYSTIQFDSPTYYPQVEKYILKKGDTEILNLETSTSIMENKVVCAYNQCTIKYLKTDSPIAYGTDYKLYVKIKNDATLHGGNALTLGLPETVYTIDDPKWITEGSNIRLDFRVPFKYSTFVEYYSLRDKDDKELSKFYLPNSTSEPKLTGYFETLGKLDTARYVANYELSGAQNPPYKFAVKIKTLTALKGEITSTGDLTAFDYKKKLENLISQINIITDSKLFYERNDVRIQLSKNINELGLDSELMRRFLADTNNTFKWQILSKSNSSVINTTNLRSTFFTNSDPLELPWNVWNGQVPLTGGDYTFNILWNNGTIDQVIASKDFNIEKRSVRFVPIRDSEASNISAIDELKCVDSEGICAETDVMACVYDNSCSINWDEISIRSSSLPCVNIVPNFIITDASENELKRVRGDTIDTRTNFAISHALIEKEYLDPRNTFTLLLAGSDVCGNIQFSYKIV